MNEKNQDSSLTVAPWFIVGILSLALVGWLVSLRFPEVDFYLAGSWPQNQHGKKHKITWKWKRSTSSSLQLSIIIQNLAPKRDTV